MKTAALIFAVLATVVVAASAHGYRPGPLTITGPEAPALPVINLRYPSSSSRQFWNGCGGFGCPHGSNQIDYRWCGWWMDAKCEWLVDVCGTIDGQSYTDGDMQVQMRVRYAQANAAPGQSCAPQRQKRQRTCQAQTGFNSWSAWEVADPSMASLGLLDAETCTLDSSPPPPQPPPPCPPPPSPPPRQIELTKPMYSKPRVKLPVDHIYGINEPTCPSGTPQLDWNYGAALNPLTKLMKPGFYDVRKSGRCYDYCFYATETASCGSGYWTCALRSADMYKTPIPDMAGIWNPDDFCADGTCEFELCAQDGDLSSYFTYPPPSPPPPSPPPS
eukprot:CAMPEP_0197846540 /NCGR_PEP_ID=MMETSP1438-20131217/3393_1 /TAXON_ID=1461541 /ORGANISM="Pterosperma sp., Strain CCMP1384" /LENGTH=330 /DNA_ID=CAMNT_0043458225 /DNA_START=61 /DNA_END=1050 /DNA_ORIENTATION=-